MIRFDNQLLENLCKIILTDKKDYRLKMSGSNDIPTNQDGITFLKEKKKSIEIELEKINKAIVLGEISIALKAKTIEEE